MTDFAPASVSAPESKTVSPDSSIKYNEYYAACDRCFCFCQKRNDWMLRVFLRFSLVG